MDGLKKEWRETQIPPEVRLRAKNRAWEIIQRPVFRMRTVAQAFAVCAVALAAFFVVFHSGQSGLEEQISPVQPPVTQNLSVGGFADVAVVGDNGDIGDIGNNADNVNNDDHIVMSVADVDRVAIVPIVPGTDNIGKAAGIEPVSNETVSREANDEAERIVFNFILPESGARLIWIVSSNY